MESLVITLQSTEKEKLYTLITELAADHECYLTQGYGLRLGNVYSVTFRVSGNWNNIAKLETVLENTLPAAKIQFLKQRALDSEKEYPALPYSAQVIAINQIGTVYNVCLFFTTRDIILENFNCETFTSSISGTNMLMISLLLSIPAATNIAELREEFLIYCEELNVDGILEPEKR